MTGSNPCVPLSYLYIICKPLNLREQSQRDWFLSESNKIDPIERPFTPDGASDLGHVWARNEGRQMEAGGIDGGVNKRLAKPNALMFFHIPLYVFPQSLLMLYFVLTCSFPRERPEAYSEPDFDSQTTKLLDVGEQLEGPGSAKHNGGFFVDGVLKAPESDVGGNEVKVCKLSQVSSPLLVSLKLLIGLQRR